MILARCFCRPFPNLSILGVFGSNPKRCGSHGVNFGAGIHDLSGYLLAPSGDASNDAKSHMMAWNQASGKIQWVCPGNITFFSESHLIFPVKLRIWRETKKLLNGKFLCNDLIYGSVSRKIRSVIYQPLNAQSIWGFTQKKWKTIESHHSSVLGKVGFPTFCQLLGGTNDGKLCALEVS